MALPGPAYTGGGAGDGVGVGDGPEPVAWLPTAGRVRSVGARPAAAKTHRAGSGHPVGSDESAIGPGAGYLQAIVNLYFSLLQILMLMSWFPCPAAAVAVGAVFKGREEKLY